MSGGVVPAIVHPGNLPTLPSYSEPGQPLPYSGFLLLDGFACPFHLCCAPVVQVQVLCAPRQSLPVNTHHKLTVIWLKENYAVKCEGKQ